MRRPSRWKPTFILTKLLEDASLSPVEQQVVMLAGSHENGCGYCMAAHSTVAVAAGVLELVLAALRGGTVLPDKKLEALHSFVIKVVRSRGRVSNERLEEFLAAGYSAQSVLEVVFGVVGGLPGFSWADRRPSWLSVVVARMRTCAQG